MSSVVSRTWGDSIRKMRFRRRLTLQQVAERCHMDTANYHKIELGERDIKLSTLLRILGALNCGITLVDKRKKR